MLTVGNISKFEGYSKFRDKKDFNNNIEMFLSIHKKAFTRTEYMLFRRLTKYAAEVPGVATVRIKRLLEAIKKIDFSIGASESTFHRMKRKAIKLGILESRPMFRTNESQASNLWIFKRFDGKEVSSNCVENKINDTPGTENEQVQTAPQKQKIVKRLTPLKAKIISKANIQNNNKRIEDMSLDSSFVSDFVPKEFIETVKPFFNNAKTIEEYWKMVKIDTYSVQRWIDEKEILTTAILSFKQMINKLNKGQKLKNKKPIENPIAYFKGILKQKIDKVYSDLPIEVFE